jgi:hypothetical protein
MKLSGFYMAGGFNEKNAKDRVKNAFNSEIKLGLKKIYDNPKLKITDAIRTSEYDEDDGIDAYDVYFILDLPEANIEEDSDDFYELERIMFTGLAVIDE